MWLYKTFKKDYGSKLINREAENFGYIRFKVPAIKFQQTIKYLLRYVETAF